MSWTARDLARRAAAATGLLPAIRGVRSRLRFAGEFRRFRALGRAAEGRFVVRWAERTPCLEDRTAATRFPAGYVYHVAWAARVLAATRPERHVDISSYLYFGVVVSAFVPVDFYDYRPAAITLDGYRAGRADLLGLPFADGSVRSLSCMHVVEHIGLGRYGDPLDPEGDRKAVRELVRVLAPGGDLLLVVPVGRPRIEFNAHRVYSHAMVLGMVAGLEVVEFALIPDAPAAGGLVRGAAPGDADRQDLGCGCFWLRKPVSGAGP